MKDKHNLYADYRALWHSAVSSYEGLIAGNHYNWRNDNKNAVGVAAVDQTTIDLAPPSGDGCFWVQTDPALANASGIVAGDNPGDYTINLKHLEHHAPTGKDHPPFVIPTEGGIF